MNFKEALIAHPYAQILRWIADGERIQERRKEWCDCDNGTLLYMIANVEADVPENYRLAPRTIFVNGVEVPAPEKVAPKLRYGYFVPNPNGEDDLLEDHVWSNSEYDIEMLKRGLVYLNKEDAIARAKAMLLTSDK